MERKGKLPFAERSIRFCHRIVFVSLTISMGPIELTCPGTGPLCQGAEEPSRKRGPLRVLLGTGLRGIRGYGVPHKGKEIP
jgi:hypothetical protein